MKPAFPLLPYQKRLVENDARFTWTNWSRQIGKSTACSLRRVIRGMARKRNQILLSAGERQSRELMLKVKQHVEAFKIGFEFSELNMFEGTSFKQLEIGIPSLRMRFIGLPANPNTARGFTGDVLLDEFSLHNHDRDIWASVFPTVLRGAGELDICSTPKGRANMFYRLRENDQFSHSTVTIDDAIADGLDLDRDAIYAAMGDDELFRQEFLCEFVDEATAFITYEMIGECEEAGLPRTVDLGELAALKGDVFVGVDIGRRRDLTVIWPFELRDKTLHSLGLIEISNTPYSEQFERLSNVLRCRCVRRCAIDGTGMGDMFAEKGVETFGEHMVEPCNLSMTFKEQAGYRMRNRFLDKLIRIPADEKIRHDLHSVQKTVTAAGNIRLNAERDDGSHADRFWAAALACHAASEGGGGPIEGISGPPSRGADMRRYL